MSRWLKLTVDAESKDEEGNTLLYLDPDHLGCLMKKKKKRELNFEK